MIIEIKLILADKQRTMETDIWLIARVELQYDPNIVKIKSYSKRLNDRSLFI